MRPYSGLLVQSDSIRGYTFCFNTTDAQIVRPYSGLHVSCVSCVPTVCVPPGIRLSVAERLSVHLEELRAQFVGAVSVCRRFGYLLLNVAERFLLVSLTV